MAMSAPGAGRGQVEEVVVTGQREKSRYLAYTHRVSIDLPVESVEERYNQILSWCAKDDEFKCILLSSGLTTDNYIRATVEVRILPKGVNEILGIASAGGSTRHKSTDVEDLGEAIVDNQKRLEMLRSYRDRLEALEKNPKNDVESLVKIASELSKVQSDLEYAEGKRSKLLQRVEMDIVNISIYSQSQKSFFKPIGASLKNFNSRLSEGISDTITAIAYLIPWLLLGSVLLYCARKIWVRVRRK
jgi:hypothetical protein